MLTAALGTSKTDHMRQPAPADRENQQCSGAVGMGRSQARLAGDPDLLPDDAGLSKMAPARGQVVSGFHQRTVMKTLLISYI